MILFLKIYVKSQSTMRKQIKSKIYSIIKNKRLSTQPFLSKNIIFIIIFLIYLIKKCNLFKYKFELPNPGLLYPKNKF